VTSKEKIVLVVDDESGIRRLVATLVAAQGFRTLEAANGLEALHVYGSYRSEIVLVITDVQMPVMDGLEAVSRMRTISPDVPVIFMTAAAGELAQKLAGWEPLRKPFKPAELVARVRSVLK
jgi:DNA-binding response OmpR family regulator